MSFTDRAIVRKHLLSSATPERVVSDLSIVLDGLETLQLPDANILPDSEIVKRLITVVPESGGAVNLSGIKAVNLPHSNIVPGSVAVAISESLAIIYLEEADYRIDYHNGLISRMDTGSISDGQQVYVYYEKFEKFDSTDDYVLDPENGMLRRTAGSAIPDGGTVRIDYTVQEGSVEDEMIDQAVIEAEDIILRSLSPEYTASSTDQGLETGATQLSLSIVARALAAQALIENRSSDASDRASEWQKLSELYEVKAWNALAPFVDPHQLHSPVVQ